MHRLTRYAIAFVAVLLLAACGGGDDTTEPAAQDDTAPADTTAETEMGTAEDDAGATEDETGAEATGEEMEEGGGEAASTLDTADSDLGTILVDGEGMTLYVFDNDSGGESSCYDACAQTWPPLVGPAEAMGDVDPALIGTTERDDGTIQVTYDGNPLYYYAADSNPGGTMGQGVGDVWWVVGPDGAKITGTSTAGDTGGTYEDGY